MPDLNLPAGRPSSGSDRVALLVEGYPGQRPVAALAEEAASGLSPRVHYVEVARALGAEVIDGPAMAVHAGAAAKGVAKVAGMPAAEVVETVIRRRQYRTVCAWSDRLGLPLALAHKLLRSPQDIVLVSQWLSRPRKARFFTRLGVGPQFRAILNSSTYQLDYTHRYLGVPAEKLVVAHRPVDERFWVSERAPEDDLICAVGWEARDYDTFVEAVAGLPVRAVVAVGMIGMSARPTASSRSPAAGSTAGADGDPSRLSVLAPWKGTYSYAMQRGWVDRAATGNLPPNISVAYQLDAQELRSLYERCRAVVVPLHDVDSNCGVTTVTEAMSMRRPVIVTLIRGQHDVIDHGEQGVYVPPRDPHALRAAIERVLRDPEDAARMGGAGRALVERRHTMDAYVAQLSDLLNADDPGPASSIDDVRAERRGER